MEQKEQTIDNTVPFKEVLFFIECPFDDGATIPVKLGWVNHDWPVLHLDAPDLIRHLRDCHGHQ